jgi:hypothetical protein
MALEAADVQDDLEQLQEHFEEFRKRLTARSRLPEPLSMMPRNLVKRYGVHPTAGALRLDYSDESVNDVIRRSAQIRLSRRAVIFEFTSPIYTLPVTASIYRTRQADQWIRRN